MHLFNINSTVESQAHAWTALGKLCLADEVLAKRAVPLFAQRLRTAKSPAVRNNIMVALSDLVIQFTALVGLFDWDKTCVSSV